MDNGERVASLLPGCGWMTPLRVPFSLSLALALLRQPLLPRRRRGSNVTKCVRRSGVISKRRVGPSGNTTLPTRPTDWLEAQWNTALARVAEVEAQIKSRQARLGLSCLFS
jgi:hypothetical protein